MSVWEEASTKVDELSFRPVHAEDLPFLFWLYAQVRADELAHVDWDEAQKMAFLEAQFVAQTQAYAAYPGADYQLILLAGAPIGRLYLARWPAELRIVDIALVAEVRSRGIGTAVLNSVFAEATARHLPVRIHVEIFNPAMRLYQRLGFRMAEDKGVYHLMEWHPSELSGEQQDAG